MVNCLPYFTYIPYITLQLLFHYALWSEPQFVLNSICSISFPLLTLQVCALSLSLSLSLSLFYSFAQIHGYGSRSEEAKGKATGKERKDYANLDSKDC